MTAPLFSVIVPTYNRPSAIKACAEGLLALPHPSFEVIIVDDGSDEPAELALAEHAGDPRLRVFRQENQGPGAARNHGARYARGRFLAFTDDDCRPVPQWLSAFGAVLQQTPDALAGGPVVNALTKNVYAAASQDIISFLYETDATATAFFTSNNFCCSAESFAEVGGFDPELRLSSEDRDFCIRYRSKGGPVLHVPEAEVRHSHDLGAVSFWRQHLRYGQGARQLSDKLAESGNAPPLAVRTPSFYAQLLSYPARRDGMKALPRSFLIALSHVAMAWGYYGSSPAPRQSKRQPSA
jgi:GT2 family glycosyltransferase